MTTSINTKHLVGRQLPGYVRESNPLFQKFLEYYYEFQENAKIPNLIQEIRKYNDIDSVEEQFLSEFFEEFRRIPSSIVSDKRLVAKHIYDIFKTKGSEQSLKLLYRIVYGEEINIRYPSENILKASDGRWIQDVIVTLNAVQGNITENSNRIKFSNVRGNFEFEIKRIEKLDDLNIRIYFEPLESYFIDTNQVFRIYCNQSLNFVGRLTQMPASIEIIDGGRLWQNGQIIIIPGYYKDSICQVKRVGTNGSIIKLDIIQHGFGYLSDETFVVSPYKYRSNSNVVEYITQSISESPVVIAHTLNVEDTTEGIIDSIIGQEGKQFYVEPGYKEPGYINRMVIRELTNPLDQNLPELGDVTFDSWRSLLAKVKVKNSFYAKSAGTYTDFRGQLSAPDIRLQDSFFYQIFSYVIETSRSLSDAKNVVPLVHPAGMKYFVDTTKIARFAVDSSVSRVMSTEFILLSDTMSVEDAAPSKSVVTTIEDTLFATTNDANNSYDANNIEELYDPNSDEWDEISPGGFSNSYTFEDYDEESYDQDPTGELEKYTDEGEKITISVNS